MKRKIIRGFFVVVTIVALCCGLQYVFANSGEDFFSGFELQDPNEAYLHRPGEMKVEGRQEIPQPFVDKYLHPEKSPFRYRYYYGKRYEGDSVVCTTVLRHTPDFQTKWGKGITEVLLYSFTKGGICIDRACVGLESDEHSCRLDYHPGESERRLTQKFTVNMFYLTRVAVKGGRLETMSDNFCTFYEILPDGAIRPSAPVRSYSNEKSLRSISPDNQHLIEAAKNPVEPTNWLANTKALRLKQAYEELSADKDNAGKQAAFFYAFPKTWGDFMEIYHYELDKMANIDMLSALGSHLEAFQNLSRISFSDKARRLIDIALEANAVGGMENRRLQAAPAGDDSNLSALQETMHSIVAKDTSAFLAILAQRRQAEQFCFWYYYFSKVPLSIGIGDSVREEHDRLQLFIHSNAPQLEEVFSQAYALAISNIYNGI